MIGSLNVVACVCVCVVEMVRGRMDGVNVDGNTRAVFSWKSLKCLPRVFATGPPRGSSSNSLLRV